MSKTSIAAADSVISAEDAAEYAGRIARLRDLMREGGFDAFIANDGGGLQRPAAASGGAYAPVWFLTNFRIFAVPLTAVVPVEGEPALILKPGFEGSFRREAERQCWIRNVISLDVGETVAAIEAYDAKVEEGEAIAEVLRASGADKGRIAYFGPWPALEVIKELLPEVKFEPAPGTWYPGQPRGTGGAPLDALPQGPFEAVSPLTRYQVKRLEETADAAQVALETYVAAVRRDATIREATREARGAAYAAGVDTLELFGSVSADPWRYWTMDMAAPTEVFKPGQMYLIQAGMCTVNGYPVQIGRSFTIGDPTPAQRHLMDMMRFAVETIMGELEIGKTGREIWASVSPTIQREGLAEWSQYGHDHGPTGAPISFSEVMTGRADGVVSEGHVLDVHPTLFDPASGDHGMSGDCVAIFGGRVRNLNRDPLPHDFI